MTVIAPVTEQLMVLPSDQDISGRTLGSREIDLVTESIRSGVLTSTKGAYVKRLETEFAERLGAKYAYACSSGSSAIHASISAIDPEPGDEIIVSPITDMGALTPILYQGAIPVFADVDDRTLNVTAQTIEAKISSKTCGIAITHLFGNPCDLRPILELAQTHNLPLIEDCAQAFLATYEGRNVGTLGTIGCFSLQQGKHMTCGEGGIVVTSDEALARRMFLFINKGFGYGDPNPDHYFIVPDGAVGLARILKAKGISSSPRYIQKPAFMCDIFQNRRTFGKSQFPFTLARPEALQYGRPYFPQAFKGLDHTLVLPWNENYTGDHVEYIATAIREAVA